MKTPDMMIKRKIKTILRPYRDLAFSLLGFIYDFYRFARHAGYYRYMSDNEKREYKAVKIYHRLEKSLSFRNRNTSSGGGAARDLIALLENVKRGTSRGFHECVGINVLNKYANQSSQGFYINESLCPCHEFDPTKGGVIDCSSQTISSGKLENPEQFFLSRHSVRDFAPRPVPPSIIKRSIELSLKTPSVCNRQAWHVYHIDDRLVMNRVLSFQNGNAGFGHEIPSLLILSSDLKAFDTAGERYQHWIDGGMFSMSVVYALHSLGLASCCLNWSKTPGDDLKLRKAVPIKPHHTVLMMLAVGYPNDAIKVCSSERRSLDSVYEYVS